MRHQFLLLLIVIPVFILSCGGSSKNKNIAIWHQMLPEGAKVLDSLAQVWAAENEYTVSILYRETEELRSSFQTAAFAGGGPDLIYGPADQVGPFSVMKLILSLDDILDDDFLVKFDEKGLVRYNGKLYQIADQIGNHLCLVYNRDLVPTPPQNTDEMVAIGKKLTNGTGTYGLVWNYTEPYFFIPWLSGFGGWVMDDNAKPTLDSQATVDALSFLVFLRDTARIVPRELDYDIADALFKEGKAGMIINGPWSWGGYRQAGLNFGVAKIPMVSKTGLWPAPMVSPLGYSINININKDKLPAVLDLLDFLTSAESQLEWTKVLATIPSNLEARLNPIVTNDPIIAASVEQMELGRPMPVAPELRAIWDAMRPPYQSVLGGSMSPDRAAKEMQDLAERKIAEMLE